MSSKEAVHSLYRRCLRLCNQFSDPIIQRKMKSNVRECFRFCQTGVASEQIQSMIKDGQAVYPILQNLLSTDKTIQDMFMRKRL